MTFGEMKEALLERGALGEYAAQVAESLVRADFALGGVGEVYVWLDNFALDVGHFLAGLNGSGQLPDSPSRQYEVEDFAEGRHALVHVLIHAKYTCALVLHSVPEGAP